MGLGLGLGLGLGSGSGLGLGLGLGLELPARTIDSAAVCRGPTHAHLIRGLGQGQR